MFSTLKKIARTVYNKGIYSTHLKYWPLIKKARMALNRPALPRPCCRQHEHRGPSYHVEDADSRLTVNHCGTCNTRHYELVVEAGEMGVVLK